MPIYEYRCEQCGHQDSDMDSINSPRVKKCPQCGRRTFSRLISAAAFHLKGGGWYATDFKNKPKTTKSAADAKDSKSAKDGNDKSAKDSNDKSADKSAKNEKK